MKKNRELGKIKLETTLFEKMEKSLELINKSSPIELSMSDFRRRSYLDFSNRVLNEGAEIVFRMVEK